MLNERDGGLSGNRCVSKLGTGMLLKTKSGRGVAFVLVFLCFLCSMWITNDVALITFVPFGLLVLRLADMERSVSLVVTLMTIAANLGSMLTPIGNPKIFIYIPLPAAVFVVYRADAALHAPCGGAARNGHSLRLPESENFREAYRRAEKTARKAACALQRSFLLCLLTVLKLIPIYILFPAVAVVLLIFNRKLLLKVDYSLLLTFAAFLFSSEIWGVCRHFMS